MPADEKSKPPQVAGRAWTQPLAFGPYLLEKRLAVGGMSEIYLARPMDPERKPERLIIKRLLPALLDDSSRAAFKTEGRLHMAAHHPNVVDVIESGEVGGEPYLALEYVSGVDAYRLMRRAQSELRAIPAGMAVFVARQLCEALTCVHNLRDDALAPVGVVHRDVTPSNVYLSETGEVKLGDFGIARSLEGPQSTQALKGKYSYLAPEQVSGDPFDHRADLFSLAVMLAELLIGQPLFPGAGQLAVLLAIRDCRIDPLREAAHVLPRGLFSVLDRALSKAPDNRYASASELSAALAPFDQLAPDGPRAELSRWVVWAADSGSLARQVEGVLRDSGNMLAARTTPVRPTPRPPRVLGRPTMPAPVPRAAVRSADGRTVGELPFAKLVELIITGELGAEDEVAMAGDPYRKLADIEVLARHLPSFDEATHRLAGPGVPDYAAELSTTSMLEVLTWILVRQETGALFADRRSFGSVPPAPGGKARGEPRSLATHKEMYFEKGAVVLVASSDRTELLGEYLVGEGLLRREELETALAALPRFQGRLGDTLIGLGLADAVDVFRAIRNQGRVRGAETFRWKSGRVAFYRGVVPQRIDFRLDLGIPELMLAGLELTYAESSLRPALTSAHRTRFVAIRPPPAHALAAAWPAPVLALIGALGTGRTLGELVTALGQRNKMSEDETLRALMVAMAGGIAERG